MDSSVYWIWFVQCFGAGNSRIWEALSHFGGDPETAYNEIKAKKADFLTEWERKSAETTHLKQSEEIINYCESKDIDIVCFDDERYPNRLKGIFNPPAVLFCMGDISFIENEISDSFVIDEGLVRGIYRPRQEFSHKGNFGKTVIAAGSSGKMGAAVLATQAALKSGSGLTFTFAPQCGYEILQTACPEAMFLEGGQDFISSFDVDEDHTIGIGPGLGTALETQNAFLTFLKTCTKPLVLDADAINILAKDPEKLKLIPKNSVITPHPKEFARLFGKTENSFERLKLAKEKATELEIYIILKDHHTQIITPEGNVFYNLTGNSGMAKGGSGDVLLGIVTSLLAQNYSVQDAALFGVWLHGKAGDFAAEKHSKEAMLPSDLIAELGNIYKYLNSFQ